ncbi:general secretion pathway protein H [Caulobacter sp. BE264]|uniref:GspH/FimT family pseudopilin n=1 Tax=Caulobacter sp. BE264 TaxID=2817724 RepID=UPI002855ACA3|nr:GspH/FimT family pseudopilin [Caulobacter sp. BE264]MDR7229899.1 general secretion pathway protein H [Caulobacter sp. BE264]
MATGADARPAKTRRVARAGFTLVELMVVLMIMGLLATAVILTLPDGKMSLSQESARFAARLLRAREESLMVNRQVRVNVSSVDYRFDIRDGRAWRALDTAPFVTTAWVEDTRVSGRDGETAVIFEPTGQASGAEFTLGRGGSGYVVSIDVAGNVAVHVAQAL